MKRIVTYIPLLVFCLSMSLACQSHPSVALDMPVANELKQDTLAYNFLVRHTQRLNALSKFAEKSNAKAAKIFEKKTFDQMTPAQQEKVLAFDFDYASRWLEENIQNSAMLVQAQEILVNLRGEALKEFTGTMKQLATFVAALRMAYPNDLRLDPQQEQVMENPGKATGTQETPSVQTQLDSLRKVQEEIVSKEEK